MANNENKTRIVGVHRVTKELADGSTKEYHYVFRGSGPRFWDSNSEFGESDPRYVSAYEAAVRKLRVKPKVDANSIASVLARYRDSREFKKLKPRTQQDYRHFLDAFEVEFGEDPITLF